MCIWYCISWWMFFFPFRCPCLHQNLPCLRYTCQISKLLDRNTQLQQQSVSYPSVMFIHDKFTKGNIILFSLDKLPTCNSILFNDVANTVQLIAWSSTEPHCNWTIHHCYGASAQRHNPPQHHTEGFFPLLCTYRLSI